MQKFKKFKNFSLMLAALGIAIFSATSEAAGDGSQIGGIVGNPFVWGGEDGYFADALRNRGKFAVTDLDGNGRLEILCVMAPRGPEELKMAEMDNENMEYLSYIPTQWDTRAFEVSADGMELVPLNIEYTDEMIPPNLTTIMECGYNPDDSIRSYPVVTVTRKGQSAYQLYQQVVSLKNGTMEVQTIAKSTGNFNINSDALPEMIPDTFEDRYHEPLDMETFQYYLQNYMAGCNPMRAVIGWRDAMDIEEAAGQPAGVRPVFEASWMEFQPR